MLDISEISNIDNYYYYNVLLALHSIKWNISLNITSHLRQRNDDKVNTFFNKLSCGVFHEFFLKCAVRSDAGQVNTSGKTGAIVFHEGISTYSSHEKINKFKFCKKNAE